LVSKTFRSSFKRLAVLLVSAGFLPLAAPVASAQQSGSPAKGTGPVAKQAAQAATKKAPAPVGRRRARARPRAIAAAKALAEARTPHFRVDEKGDVVPDVRAAAAIVYDPATGEVLWEENAQDQRSIASITKVMTAVVFLETATDLSEVATVLREDTRRASTTYLKTSDRVRLEDLLHLLLIPSDNAAARALARLSPLGYKGFVERMNEKAVELGLTTTTYSDPSGLDSNNVSSAFDMARLIAFAAEDEVIGPIMRKPEYSFRTANTRPRPVSVRSTNEILRAGDVEVRGGKTGFISKAGYCLATLLKLPEGGPSLAVVVLGATTSIGRFWEARHLLTWLDTKARVLSLSTPGTLATFPAQ
jgi:D-alanyl-D-alanine endopeptidase (penicillin-binding protein 7)